MVTIVPAGALETVPTMGSGVLTPANFVMAFEASAKSMPAAFVDVALTLAEAKWTTPEDVPITSSVNVVVHELLMWLPDCAWT
jgi:hypothetical protein